MKKNQATKEVKSFDYYLIDGKWYHCLWVRSGKKLKQYIDGVLVYEQKTKDVERPTDYQEKTHSADHE